jgi:hypothetical protein
LRVGAAPLLQAGWLPAVLCGAGSEARAAILHAPGCKHTAPPAATALRADAGAKVVVGHQSFGEMALHFVEKYGMMAIKIPSKFDLRRFCRATGAPAAEGVWGGRHDA